jgi:hypothetical protein
MNATSDKKNLDHTTWQRSRISRKAMCQRGVSYNKMNDVDRSRPCGKAEESYLIHKLRGTQTNIGALGEQMPSDAPTLDLDLIGKIWQLIGEARQTISAIASKQWKP